MTVPTVEITVSFSLQCIRQPDWFVKQNLIVSFSCSNRSQLLTFREEKAFQFYGSKTGSGAKSRPSCPSGDFFTDWSLCPPPSGPLSVTEIHQEFFAFWPAPHTFRSFILLTHLADMVQTRLSGQDLAAPPPHPTLRGSSWVSGAVLPLWALAAVWYHTDGTVWLSCSPNSSVKLHQEW